MSCVVGVDSRNVPVPAVDVQKCNCNTVLCPHFNKQTRANHDACYVDYQTVQSVSQGAYQLQNFNSCECGAPGPHSAALSQPMINFQNNAQWGGENGCVIDNDSILRLENKLTNYNTINQLFTRPYLTIPYMGKGEPQPFEETVLQPGEDTSMKKSCNTLAGVTIDNFFTPMVDNLRDQVQNPIHLIPEDNMKSWVRGGLSSRAMVRNFDYVTRCGAQTGVTMKELGPQSGNL